MLNANAMASDNDPVETAARACVDPLETGACLSAGGCTGSFSPDDTLNNDYFYDDEFAVPFDAHIAAAAHRQLCRSLTDSCLDDDDDDDVDGNRHLCAGGGWRGCRLTLSRSESCLYRSAAADSQGDEMMSTSERAANDDLLVSSSELSDLDAANQRPLFSPLPPDAEAAARGGVAGDARDGDGSVTEMGESTASGEGGARLRCAMYDATSAKRQYRLSFGAATRTSSSAEDCARWTSTKTVSSSGGAGLTTWRQVSRIQPIVEPGFTTWQRLRSSPNPSSGAHTTARSVNLVEWSTRGHSINPCRGSPMGRSGQLLRLYQSTRTASASPSAPARQQTTSDQGKVDRHGTPPCQAAPDLAVSRASRRSSRTAARSGRRAVAGRVDKCVQCLPSFRDRCVQTSASALVRADKSLQTSDVSVHGAALLLSRPLPDLDFLRLCTSGSAAASRTEVVETAAAVGERRHSDGAAAGVGAGPAVRQVAVCPRSSSLGDSGHGVSSAESGRSSSARRHHGSDSALSNNSNNSSSSSGIEPGDPATTTSHDRSTSASVGPRKPPRSFTVEPRPSAVNQRRHTDGDLPAYSVLVNNASPTSSSLQPVCDDARCFTCCCDEGSLIPNDDEDCILRAGGALRRWQTMNCNLVDDAEHTDDSETNQAVCTRDFLASHPLCRRSPSRGTARHKAVEGLVSPTRPKEAEVSARTSLRAARRRSACHVHGHHHHHHHHQPHHHQTSPAKPAKSILVRRRQRGKVRHRLWTTEDPHDDEAAAGGSSECYPAAGDDQDDPASPSPQRPASRVARPVSLPDATVLYAGLTNFPGDELSVADHHEPCPVNSCHADDDDDAADSEHFRAKKSVSFSEKIFYHSMPSVSPLESPLCPLKLPAAPECHRFNVAAVQPTAEIHTSHGTYTVAMH